MPFALAVSGAAFLIHEQNGWLFARSAFLHHALGWTLARRRDLPARRWSSGGGRVVLQAGFALTIVVIAVLLYSRRDMAPIFGHLSPLAGEPHR